MPAKVNIIFPLCKFFASFLLSLSRASHSVEIKSRLHSGTYIGLLRTARVVLFVVFEYRLELSSCLCPLNTAFMGLLYVTPKKKARKISRDQVVKY